VSSLLSAKSSIKVFSLSSSPSIRAYCLTLTFLCSLSGNMSQESQSNEGLVRSLSGMSISDIFEQCDNKYKVATARGLNPYTKPSVVHLQPYDLPRLLMRHQHPLTLLSVVPSITRLMVLSLQTSWRSAHILVRRKLEAHSCHVSR
jgi:hypothetical protein